jgi:hypothetical protein
MAGSKNQRRHLKKETGYRKDAEGIDIKPVKYIGPFGKYMAGMTAKGELIEDANGKPKPYAQI